MKELRRFKNFTAALLAIGLSAPAIVMAETSNERESVVATVSYADLNLENEAGARTLYGRLQQATQEVCGVTSGKRQSPKRVFDAQQLHNANQCYREKIAEAVENIDNEHLTRIHALADRRRRVG